MNRKKLWVSAVSGVMALILVVSMASQIPGMASAASSSEIKSQLDELKSQNQELEAQKAALEGQLSDNLSEMEAVVAQKDIIDQEIFLLHSQVENINEQIAAYSVLIADKQQELDEAQTRQAELREKNKERIRAMEEDGALSYWSVLFKANSFSDLLDRLNMIEEIAASDRRRLEEMRVAAEEVTRAREELEAEKTELEATRTELNATQEELGAKREEADALLAELNARGEEYELLLAQCEDETEELLASIAQKEQEYEEALDKEYWATYVPPTTKPPANNGGGSSTPPPTNGDWMTPVNYTCLSSPYGWRIHPVYGDWRFHSGVDLSAPQGTPIYASRSGVVTTATYDSSAGYYVIINHRDGFSTGYLHMTHYIVSVGQEVAQGQIIGYVGSTGTSTGPHLHFTMYYNGSTVNPADYLYLPTWP